MIYVAYYLIFSAITCLILGAAIKNKRCADMGISHEEDQRLQDEAQMHYLRTYNRETGRGETINVIDNI